MANCNVCADTYIISNKCKSCGQDTTSSTPKQ